MFYKKLKPKFVLAYGPFKWFLETWGYAAVTTPWFSIYIRKPWLHDRQLRKHELVHIAQMKREGPIWMSMKYLYYLVKVGYRNNPYEIEARRIAGK